MPTFFRAQAQSSRGLAVAVALLLIYVVWGTTYFAIGIAVQTMPPLLMNALRFLCAGGVMLLVALWQGHALPTALQWRNAAVVGGCMVFLAMNLTGFAQKLGIGSGLMATVVTTMPMWLALWSRWGGVPSAPCCWLSRAIFRPPGWARCWPLPRRWPGALARTHRVGWPSPHLPWRRPRNGFAAARWGWWWPCW